MARLSPLLPSKGCVGRTIRNDLTTTRARVKAAARRACACHGAAAIKLWVGRLVCPAVVAPASSKHLHALLARPPLTHAPKELTRQGRAWSQRGDRQVVEGDLVPVGAKRLSFACRSPRRPRARRGVRSRVVTARIWALTGSCAGYHFPLYS